MGLSVIKSHDELFYWKIGISCEVGVRGLNWVRCGI